MKVIHMQRKPISGLLIFTYTILLCFWANQAPAAASAQPVKKILKVTLEQGNRIGTGFLEQEPGAEFTGKQSKKFPWLIVTLVAVAGGVLLYFLVQKKKSCTLTVAVGPGVIGTPAAGYLTKKKGTKVSYNYSLQSGYDTLSVTLDGASVAASGTVNMNADHTLLAGSNNPNPPPEGVDLGTLGEPDEKIRTTAWGLCLMGGGTDVDTAMQWMIGRSGGGDCVVIRSSGTNAYNSYLMGLTGDGGVKLNSCQTLRIDSVEEANSAYVDKVIRNAEMLFIAGGDQGKYYTYWKDTKLQAALQYLNDVKKVPLGGTSAGMMVLSKYMYIPGMEPAPSATSADALADPYCPNMAGAPPDLNRAVKNDFLSLSFMENVVTDTHFVTRDRIGRWLVFMARCIVDYGKPYNSIRGIACNENTAVCIDASGRGKVFGSTHAYFAVGNGGTPERCVAGSPLTWERDGQAVKYWKLAANANGTNTFDLAAWNTASALPAYLSVHAGVVSPANPY